MNPLGNVLSVGEGIDMVQAAGGQLSTQWGIAGNEFTGSNQKADGLYDRKSAAFTIGIYGTLLVNNQGRRFSNEASSRICRWRWAGPSRWSAASTTRWSTRRTWTV